jgi:hypothetical protein
MFIFTIDIFTTSIIRKASCTSLIDEVFGNFTFVGEPVEPVYIMEDEIPIGEAHTYTYELEKEHKYHIYLCGEWANPKIHITDYDIYVYEITHTSANFKSSHTESAGLPEQIGNDGLGRFYESHKTGTYWFNVRNDAIESSSAEAGTFIVVENVEPNQWINRYMKGKVNDHPVKKTNWSYEFVTSSDHIRVVIDVPSSLDMYEARLYLMANPAAGIGELLREIPIAWEPGLRGELKGLYGGFNFDPQGFRHLDAMDSCEFSGEDMEIDYNVPVKGEILFHLVLIAEYGSGTINFLIQTDFDPPYVEVFNPHKSVHENKPIELKFMVEDESPLNDVLLAYTTDNGETWLKGEVNQSEDGNYTGLIQALNPGKEVEYSIMAIDSLGNRGNLTGTFKVFGISKIDLEPYKESILGGDKFTVKGNLSPAGKDIKIYYLNDTYSIDFTLKTDHTGFFRHDFIPMSPGNWFFRIEYEGEDNFPPFKTKTLNFTVTKHKSSLSCDLINDRILGGEEIEILGHLIPHGRELQIFYTYGSNIFNYSVKTAESDGYFSHSFRPNSAGEWQMYANYSGGMYHDSVESNMLNFTVDRIYPILTCQTNKKRVEMGKKVTIFGEFGVKKADINVILFLRPPNGSRSLQIPLMPSGNYSKSIRPNVKGTWEIQAEVKSDELIFETVTSNIAEIKVINPSLTTTLLRYASTFVIKVQFLTKPPYLYGIIIVVAIGGGIVFFLRWRE